MAGIGFFAAAFKIVYHGFQHAVVFEAVGGGKLAARGLHAGFEQQPKRLQDDLPRGLIERTQRAEHGGGSFQAAVFELSECGRVGAGEHVVERVNELPPLLA